MIENMRVWDHADKYNEGQDKYLVIGIHRDYDLKQDFFIVEVRSLEK